MDVDVRQFYTGDPNKADTFEAQLERVGYDPSGDVINPDDNLCLARKATSPATGKTRFFVRHVISGRRSGHMFDKNQDDLDLLKSNRPRQGQPPYQFKEVSRQAFDYYVEFLTTSNNSFLRRAERE